MLSLGLSAVLVAGWAQPAPDVIYVGSQGVAGLAFPPGSRGRPYPRLEQALMEAGQKSGPVEIRMAAEFFEIPPLELKDGISIIGGFNGRTWEPETGRETVLTLKAGPGKSIAAFYIGGVNRRAELRRLNIRVPSPQEGSGAGIGIIASASPGLIIRDCTIEVESGPKVPDQPARRAANNGRAGAPGGSGHANRAVNAYGGAGGLSIDITQSGHPVQGHRGGNGRYKADGQYGAPDALLGGLRGRAGRTGTDGHDGSNGKTGSLGANGKSGQRGWFEGGEWMLEAGTSAGHGTPGTGGGGGGAGGGQTGIGVIGGTGNGGGGGGAGGSGGLGGLGGAAGSSSFGIVLIESEGAQIIGCRIVVGDGTKGGSGSAGSPGGQGGPGGRGGRAGAGEVGRGGDGGPGGRGGAGGFAGGGAGGWSVGVYLLRSGTAEAVKDSRITHGKAGKGGDAVSISHGKDGTAAAVHVE